VAFSAGGDGVGRSPEALASQLFFFLQPMHSNGFKCVEMR
jgi:hypothetical protein